LRKFLGEKFPSYVELEQIRCEVGPDHLALLRKTHHGKGMTMKTRIALTTGLVGLFLIALAAPAIADDKEVTITGEGKCAACLLKEGDKHQTVIETKEEGKTVKYYVAENEVAKKFPADVCTGAKKVTATGTVKEVDGKKVLTASKIELAKQS
jgi:hypothetical protein